MSFDRETLEFKRKANIIRRDIIEMIYRAGSGHPGPSLSCVDILLVIYDKILSFRSDDPSWKDRDRVVLSKGHAAPALYAIIAHYYDNVTRQEMMETFRTCEWSEEDERLVNTRFQGHPDMNLLPGVEFSSGALGNGLGFACSIAEELRMRWRTERHLDAIPRVYCVVGDGELDEGSCREAMSYAGANHLDNLIVIVDNNKHQLTGKKEEVLNYGAVRDQFNPNQWDVIDKYLHTEDLNGHDFRHLSWALGKAARADGKPTVIIASTIKGKGVAFMEDDAAYHGAPPQDDEYEVAIRVFDITDRVFKNRLAELDKELNNISLSANFLDNPKFAPREAYGRALYALGKNDERIVRIDADLRSSCKGDYFYNHFRQRCYEVGIAEAMMTLLSGAFAREGKIPFINTFSIFYLKAMEQIRNVVAYNKLNVKIIGSHGDPRLTDGGSHAESEMLGIMRSIPNMCVLQPADGLMTYRLVEEMVKHEGPVFMRFGRDKIPMVYNGKKNPDYGKPIDNGPDTKVSIGSSHLLKEGRHVTIAAIGDMVHAACMAAGMLEKEGIFPTVLDIYSIKPMDEDLVIRYSKTPIVTAEPHSIVGGLGSAVSEISSSNRPQYVKRVGINDHFTKSGPTELLSRAYGLTAGRIAEAAKEILARAG